VRAARASGRDRARAVGVRVFTLVASRDRDVTRAVARSRGGTRARAGRRPSPSAAVRRRLPRPVSRVVRRRSSCLPSRRRPRRRPRPRRCARRVPCADRRRRRRRRRRRARAPPRARAIASDIAQVALELDADTLTAIGAGVLGVGAGLGIPIFFVWQEKRDKERLEEIRELNRATLKATGEQMSPEEIAELRPSRYLDRREFKDDD